MERVTHEEIEEEKMEEEKEIEKGKSLRSRVARKLFKSGQWLDIKSNRKTITSTAKNKYRFRSTADDENTLKETLSWNNTHSLAPVYPFHQKKTMEMDGVNEKLWLKTPWLRTSKDARDRRLHFCRWNCLFLFVFLALQNKIRSRCMRITITAIIITSCPSSSRIRLMNGRLIITILSHICIPLSSTPIHYSSLPCSVFLS